MFSSAGCKDGWTKTGSKCYKLFSELKTYWEAMADCADGQGGRLAAPRTQEIHAALVTLWKALADENAQTWVGLDDCGGKSTTCDTENTFTFSTSDTITIESGSYDAPDSIVWMCSDGTSPCYTNWKSGQPTSTKDKYLLQDCVRIDKTEKWDDSKCDLTKTYFCEKDP